MSESQINVFEDSHRSLVGFKQVVAVDRAFGRRRDLTAVCDTGRVSHLPERFLASPTAKRDNRR